ncbi:DUF2563 family protein [Mycolicibacterium moriokaense]|uniref:DUF2563 family protein n=1 Tax=Mycolicibacterium moriokaense TaxID=39691 RepID=UPI003C6E80DE
MKVDTNQLRTGATGCADAAGMALSGAERLGGKAPRTGIFGDFAEAQGFHATVVASHKSHVDQLHGHHRSLTAIGDRGHAAAATFSSTDESERASIVVAGAAFKGS